MNNCIWVNSEILLFVIVLLSGNFYKLEKGEWVFDEI